jgi:phosphopantothenate-cysteine ligase
LNRAFQPPVLYAQYYYDCFQKANNEGEIFDILMDMKDGWQEARALNILITAGGTSEKIDDVRRITNSGTGRLGALIAEAFAACGRDCHITYLCSAGAVRPRIASSAAGDLRGAGGASLETRVADDVLAVKAAVQKACAETAYDVIVHSMAIGDYCVRAVSDADLMAQELSRQLPELSGDELSWKDALLSPPQIRAAKISSDKENLIVVLEKAPKIIALFRGLAPSAVIVGFKLLADVTEGDLVRVGYALLEKNDCDYVLANDMNTVRTNRHEGLLIARDKAYERAYGKGDIAALIVRRALERLPR